MKAYQHLFFMLLIALSAFVPTDSFSQEQISPIVEWHASNNYAIGFNLDKGFVLAGQIEDLTGFSDAENPFEWGVWPDVPYESVYVEDGVLIANVGDAGSRPVRLLSAPLAWWLDMDQFRYLEIEFSREQSIGNGQLWFRKNGNSVVTPGQTAVFRITDGNHGDRVRLILDLKNLSNWGEGALTGMALDFHVGTGPSRNNTIDRLYQVRIATELEPKR